MANSTGGAGNNVDEIRYRSYLTQMERQQDAEVKEKEERHRDRLMRTNDFHQTQEEQLKKDYDVKISEEAELLEKNLAQVRERNTAIVSTEKESGEQEAQKIQKQYQSRINEEKKNGEEQITKLHTQYKKAHEELTRQFDREAAKASQKGRSA